jgi:hypothetical protein
MPDRKTYEPEPDDAEQYRRFIDMAREVEADEAPKADIFQRAVRRLGETPRERRQTNGNAPKGG